MNFGGYRGRYVSAPPLMFTFTQRMSVSGNMSMEWRSVLYILRIFFSIKIDTIIFNLVENTTTKQ